MKNMVTKYSALIFISFFAQSLLGQESKLTPEYKKEVVAELSRLINDFYIYPALADKTSKHLATQFEAGYFTQYSDNQAFAKALTEEVQLINKDKHMRVMWNEPIEAPENSLEQKAAMRRDQINNFRSFNHGFRELQLLEGNVAYLILSGFPDLNWAKETADSYMKLLSQADAIIIDVSKNGGGSPYMVQYLCSYFFDQKLHLNSLYYREGERTEEYWTLEEVGGKKMTDVPLFVVVGEETFSGAEEFSYNMQTQKRATLVGQITAGAANPGGTRMINEELGVFIPTGRAINPITNTSWEGTGVVPDIVTKKENTFDQVKELAQKAAEEYKTSKLESYLRLLKELNQHLDQYEEGVSETNISNSLSNLVNARLYSEWDINNLGYEYLMKKNKPKIGLCILASNTIHFPESPNVFDSYGEALKINGDLPASLASYEKALEIATKNNDQNLEYFKNALQEIREEMK